GIDHVVGDDPPGAEALESAEGLFGAFEGALVADDVAAERVVVVTHRVAAGDLGAGDVDADHRVADQLADLVVLVGAALGPGFERLPDASGDLHAEAISGNRADGAVALV